ncbi:MAG TPA: histidine kinase [Cyanobacteria bacterium UBA8803]|nr:histidine kinase [Cyanobacteria bacterium UBA9273]HBL58298.1 histidine kinase [Cyanobacteria bacterium UBA8803]
MAEPENRIFCRLDGLTPAAREEKRLTTLKELGLLDTEIIAVFDEATQTAAQFLDAPLCLLSILTSDRQLIKSAVGLSRVGLMNELAQSRELPRHEGFCTYVADTHQVLIIPDTATNPVFASSLWVGYYGIRSYLGAPLLTSDRQCLGTLAVMDLVPRSFAPKDVEFLTITARWALSEFERNYTLKRGYRSTIPWQPKSFFISQSEKLAESNPTKSDPDISTDLSTHLSSTNSIKLKLLTQLTEELRTPLTSIMGMASVLNRQIYGPLTNKQKEYLEIIHNRGQHLVWLIEEIVALGLLDETGEQLNLIPIDIEMLCQQAIKSLLETVQQNQPQIRLSVEPGNRIWFLDKEKVRQMLYYLLFSTINSAVAGSEVRIHVSRKSDPEMGTMGLLQIAVWLSHPWLGDGLPQLYGEIIESPLPSPSKLTTASKAVAPPLLTSKPKYGLFNSRVCQSPTPIILPNNSVAPALSVSVEPNQISRNSDSRENLGLLLSCHLAELHGGQISVQGLSESSYRYVIRLPQLEPPEEKCSLESGL